MTTNLSRPEMKVAHVKVTDADMAYFALGLDTPEFVLPSERDDYRSDARAIELVRAIQSGADMSGKSFKGINLKNADLTGAKLSGADLSDALLYRTDLKNADLTGADLTGAYLEGVDFSGADLTGADFTGVFARALNLKQARVDDDTVKRLSVLEVLIQKIESGEIDIRFLSRSDLMCLDLRRLDLTHVDLSGLDLSVFVLEGVNLRGTYIDPKQLMSLEGLQHYYQLVASLNAKRLATEEQRVLMQRQSELKAYARTQVSEAHRHKIIYSNAADLHRPRVRVPVPVRPEDEVTLPVKPTATLQDAIRVQNEINRRDALQAEQRERRDVLLTEPETLVQPQPTPDKTPEPVAPQPRGSKISEQPETEPIDKTRSPMKKTAVTAPVDDGVQAQELKMRAPKIERHKESVLAQKSEAKKQSVRPQPVSDADNTIPAKNPALGQHFDENYGIVWAAQDISTQKQTAGQKPKKSEKYPEQHIDNTEKITERNSFNQKVTSGLNVLAASPRKIASQAFETADTEETIEPARFVDRQDVEPKKEKTKNRI